MTRRALAPLAALALSACAQIAPDARGALPDHICGNIWETGRTIANNWHRPVRLDGHYFSAGTMWLAAPRACVTPDARFGFHGPSYGGLPGTPEEYAAGVAYMAAHYPGPLGDWFKARYADQRVTGWADVARLSGADLIEMGAAQECTR